MPPLKKSQREAAARAQAKQHPPKLSSQSLDAHNGISNLPPPNTNQTESQAAELQPEPPKDLDLFLESLGDTSDSDCGYEGGVTIDVSGVEYVPDEHDSEFTESELSEFDEEIIEALKSDAPAGSAAGGVEGTRASGQVRDVRRDGAGRGAASPRPSSATGRATTGTPPGDVIKASYRSGSALCRACRVLPHDQGASAPGADGLIAVVIAVPTAVANVPDQ
ncbi:hypothetical protein B0H17DRAFT_1138530 [Mycena rosella]|uniref:Uncharacterized protein n=1 Tax=Mycena rosella TaxID=1033263 RepID=A0AAD7D6K1_MYCRO|nr:hypothetical protein B0H17DRAFT_1138530 [Mycena rosella]